MKTIMLTSGDVALVDDEDYERLSAHRWHRFVSLSGTVYPQASVDGRTVQMHRLLIEVPDGLRTDHRNGNGLDNQKDNLRPCTHMENMRNRKRQKNNRSGYKGVCFSKSVRNPWLAQISADGVRHRLGYFETKERAYDAYCVAAKRLHGEFARLV